MSRSEKKKGGEKVGGEEGRRGMGKEVPRRTSSMLGARVDVRGDPVSHPLGLGFEAPPPQP